MIVSPRVDLKGGVNLLCVDSLHLDGVNSLLLGANLVCSIISGVLIWLNTSLGDKWSFLFGT